MKIPNMFNKRSTKKFSIRLSMWAPDTRVFEAGHNLSNGQIITAQMELRKLWKKGDEKGIKQLLKLYELKEVKL